MAGCACIAINQPILIIKREKPKYQLPQQVLRIASMF